MTEQHGVTGQCQSQRIPPPAVLPSGAYICKEDEITILSYNILLPNSVDGWWVYKMYSFRHGVPAEDTTWEVRKALLRQEISTANSDIVCFQEVSAESFEGDFAFMEELGYDRSEMYKRGRFRPATFWKSSRVEAVADPFHRDRVLVIPFRRVQVTTSADMQTESENDQCSATIKAPPPPPPHSHSHSTISVPTLPDIDLPLYVANCHLQAGEHAAERRLRQMHDALESIRKDAVKVIQKYQTNTNKIISSFKKSRKKQLQKQRVVMDGDKLDSSSNHVVGDGEITIPVLPWACRLSAEDVLQRLPVVVLGDMNCDPSDHSAAHALLLYGEASTQAGDKDKSKSKSKKQLLGEFVDVYDFAYSAAGGQPPPTMICEHLYGVITDPVVLSSASTEENQSQQQEQQEMEVEERHELSAMAETSIRGMFEKFATKKLKSASCGGDSGVDGEVAMCSSDVRRWLVTINLADNRGSELRGALARMMTPTSDAREVAGGDGGSYLEELPDNDGYESAHLTWTGFRDIYVQAINEGKVWSVSWDLAACGYPVNPSSTAVFSARYDRAYVSHGWMRQRQGHLSTDEKNGHGTVSAAPSVLLAVADLGVGSVEEGCLGVGGCLPNQHHPSDHLPISLTVRL
mmetsp:Transcript_24750/g.41857  ORF Transcript_24750/g.41857 Transcript_24750/m.41857 type:complete len:632 (+) Transcript_24750:90-1985(+)|eukprot:CAMPEP_0114465364 /NCGR_PEP_ID=MMETSP0104-20121206/8458_1 /TAXON_ID=37642 ORGANISM="Paraphysomonas imperforata, Strain PA2" /NCGR_SAMPLE_ID=MMETSP0104 /ASSEMBLY_ACC=CAM_ASM_000202 /LENGTH=631 /DNA_ID=CAMNT_0001638575 /DNA_START=1 /DNA_END=1896 /DNA_ORIENTATION=+